MFFFFNLFTNRLIYLNFNLLNLNISFKLPAYFHSTVMDRDKDLQ